MRTRTSGAELKRPRGSSYSACPSCGAPRRIEGGRLPRVCVECGAIFPTGAPPPDFDAGSDEPARVPFQTNTKPRGRPILALRAVLLLVALVATVAAVKALQKRAALEFMEERAQPKEGRRGFIMIDVTPPRSNSATAEPSVKAPPAPSSSAGSKPP